MDKCTYCEDQSGYVFAGRGGTEIYAGKWSGPFAPVNPNAPARPPHGVPMFVNCANCGKRIAFTLAATYPAPPVPDESPE